MEMDDGRGYTCSEDGKNLHRRTSNASMYYFRTFNAYVTHKRATYELRLLKGSTSKIRSTIVQLSISYLLARACITNLKMSRQFNCHAGIFILRPGAI
jgi:hypothetical protein